MARPPGSTVLAAAVVVGVGAAALAAFLLTEGLDRANLWAGVLALFLTIVAVAAQVWSTWLSAGRRADGRTTSAATVAPGPLIDGSDGPAGDPGRSGDAPPEEPADRLPVAVGRFPTLPGGGRWSYPALAAGLAAAVLAVLVVVNLPGGTDRPKADPSGSEPVGPAGWMRVRTGERLTLTDGQSFDLDRGVAGGEHAPGADLLLSQGADRLTVSEPGDLAVVDAGGGHPVQRCLAADNWDGMINGMHELTTGTDICVRTADHRCAMLTIETPPDVLVRVLTFHYSLWERR